MSLGSEHSGRVAVSLPGKAPSEDGREDSPLALAIPVRGTYARPGSNQHRAELNRFFLLGSRQSPALPVQPESRT